MYFTNSRGSKKNCVLNVKKLNYDTDMYVCRVYNKFNII